MSRKVDTRALRTGVTKDWASTWFAEGHLYADNLVEDDKIRKCLKKKLRSSGVDEIKIERSIQKLTIIIRVAKPGIVIGKKGSGLAEIRTALAKITKSDIDLQVEEVKKPDLSASILAENLAMQIERRIHVKRAMNAMIRRTMEAGAKGVKVQISGTVNGPNSIAMLDKAKEGSVPTQTIRADIDFDKATAYTRGGSIGIKVWVYKGEIENVNA